jgi:CheY-like chemotaxis protein
LHFNAERKIREDPFGNELLSLSSDKLKDFDNKRLVLVDSVRVDEHSRLTLTKRVREVYPIVAGDTIIVYQDRYNKDLLFDVQRQNNIVDRRVVRRNPTSTFSGSINKTNAKTYQDELNDITTGSSQNLSNNYSDNNNKNSKILLIDDEEDLLTVYKLFLTSAGYMNLKSFANPREGVKHFIDLKNASYYDLVILDIRMEDINGFQLYQMLKIIHPKIKALFVSALDAAEEMRVFLPWLKADDFIRKPVEQDDFIKKVKDLLSC